MDKLHQIWEGDPTNWVPFFRHLFTIWPGQTPVQVAHEWASGTLRSCGKRRRTLAPATISSLWQIVVIQDGGWLGLRFGPATGVDNDEFLVVAMVLVLKPGNCGLQGQSVTANVSIDVVFPDILSYWPKWKSLWLACRLSTGCSGQSLNFVEYRPCDPSAINQRGVFSLLGSPTRLHHLRSMGTSQANSPERPTLLRVSWAY